MCYPRIWKTDQNDIQLQLVCCVLQTQDLRVDQADKSCIGLTQENSIENSVYLIY